MARVIKGVSKAVSASPSKAPAPARNCSVRLAVVGCGRNRFSHAFILSALSRCSTIAPTSIENVNYDIPGLHARTKTVRMARAPPRTLAKIIGTFLDIYCLLSISTHSPGNTHGKPASARPLFQRDA